MGKQRAELIKLDDAALERELTVDLSKAQSGSDAVMRVLEEYDRRASVAQMAAAKSTECAAFWASVAAVISGIALLANTYFQYLSYDIAARAYEMQALQASGGFCPKPSKH